MSNEAVSANERRVVSGFGDLVVDDSPEGDMFIRTSSSCLPSGVVAAVLDSLGAVSTIVVS